MKLLISLDGPLLIFPFILLELKCEWLMSELRNKVLCIQKRGYRLLLSETLRNPSAAGTVCVLFQEIEKFCGLLGRNGVHCPAVQTYRWGSINSHIKWWIMQIIYFIYYLMPQRYNVGTFWDFLFFLRLHLTYQWKEFYFLFLANHDCKIRSSILLKWENIM